MYTFKKENIINYLIALIPLSIILGNLAINVNVVLICIAGLFFYKTNIFFIKNKKLQYLLYTFFLYLIIITAVNNIPNFKYDILNKEHLVKSIFFLRFLIFFLVVYKVVEKGELNINYFLISAAFFSIFLSIDIIIQYIFGKDLFGYTSVGNKRAGFFGTEFIAGGYLKNFSLITIFFLISLYKLKKNINDNIYIIFLFIVFFIPILLTLNRMPTLIFLSCFIFFLLI